MNYSLFVSYEPQTIDYQEFWVIGIKVRGIHESAAHTKIIRNESDLKREYMALLKGII